MRRFLAYQSLSWETETNFDGTGASMDGPARYAFSMREPRHLVGLVYPRLAFTFWTDGEEDAPSSILLYLRNPNDDRQRKVLFEDASGTVWSFTEDNLGQGQPVPYVRGKEGERYELIFVTTGIERYKHALLEIWWEPNNPFGFLDRELSPCDRVCE